MALKASNLIINWSEQTTQTTKWIIWRCAWENYEKQKWGYWRKCDGYGG